MHVQVDMFEDNGMTVLLLYPEGHRSFDVPRERLPQEAKPVDVFEVSFVHHRQETERVAAENRRLLEDLLGWDGQLWL